MIRRARGRYSLGIWPSRPGITLVDLVICVMIMGILAAVSAPRFSSTVAKLRCEAVAKRIASDVNYARRTAIQSSSSVTVSFRSTPAGYDMSGVSDPANPANNYSVDLPDVDPSVALTAFDFDGTASLTFNHYGRPVVGAAPLGSGHISVTCNGHTFDVAIAAATGEAIVQ